VELFVKSCPLVLAACRHRLRFNFTCNSQRRNQHDEDYFVVDGDHAGVLAVLGGRAISAQDKYTVQVPDGLAFSEFRGYEDWQVIAVSQTGDLIEVILGNPEIIAAYQAGVPANGKAFPDGSKMAKSALCSRSFRCFRTQSEPPTDTRGVTP
jgi:hypothetical protein